jgi:hypothetical protein
LTLQPSSRITAAATHHWVAKIFAKLTGLPSTSFTVRSLPAAPIGTLL